MSLSRLRLIPSALALAAAALLTAGCGAGPASPAPTSTGGADAVVPGSERTVTDIEAGWLDGGRMIAVVTWGSSTPTCRPAQSDALADGQTVMITLTDPEEASEGCDSDLVPRATIVMVPEGVDVTQDVELEVSYGDIRGDADLEGLDAAPQGTGEQQSSAGWFDDDGIVLLTWGSSSCPPAPEQVVQAKDQISVSFASDDRVCTMDFAPRATVIMLSTPRIGDGPFTLRMQGDNLDGEVTVR